MNPERILDPAVKIIGAAGAARGQHCSAELVGLVIYGDMLHGYRLPCLDRAANEALVAVNDRLDDEQRDSTEWRKTILRVAQCHKTGNDRHARRMALWAARSVEQYGPPEGKACNDVTERWLAGEATDEELLKASCAAFAASAAAAGAFAASAAGAYAAYAAFAASRASAAPAYAVAAAAEDLIDWLNRYVDVWLKTAADEGCLLDAGDDPDYARFLAEMDELVETMAE